MEYTLLDAIERGDTIVHKDRLEYERRYLTQGVKELSVSFDKSLCKRWTVTFEGVSEFDRFNKICKDNKYLLMVADIEGQIQYFRKHFHAVGLEGYLKERRMVNLLRVLSKCEKSYHVYKEKNPIACVTWVEYSQFLFLSTSQKEGLQLAEDYRKSLLKR